jgi:hypothetical protein
VEPHPVPLTVLHPDTVLYPYPVLVLHLASHPVPHLDPVLHLDPGPEPDLDAERDPVQLPVPHPNPVLYSAFGGSWQTNAMRTGRNELRNADDYHIPHAHTNHLDRFPMFSYLREWNMAGPAKYHRNALTFKLELKNMGVN